jgi:hypothetical protein
MQGLDVKVSTLSYDVGVFALLTFGIGTLFANLLLGGLLLAAAPVLALVVRGKAEEEYRKKAIEAAPAVLKAVGEQIGPKLDAMIEEFAKKLDAWVVTAGEELHREVLEVLHATRDARERTVGDAGEADARKAVEAQAERLAAATKRIEELKGGMWGARVRVQ